MIIIPVTDGNTEALSGYIDLPKVTEIVETVMWP